jgi:hypothetical protein
MSICRLNKVAKAQKDQGRCQICGQPVTKGQAYGWWKGRYTPRYVAHAGCPVPAWRRETNATKSEAMQAAELVIKAQNALSPDAAALYLRDAISMIESVRDTLQERVDSWQGTGLENSYQAEACSNTIYEYDQWLSDAEDWASELESLGPEPDEPIDDPEAHENGDYAVAAQEHTDWLEAFEEAQGAIEDAPELDMGA